MGVPDYTGFERGLSPRNCCWERQGERSEPNGSLFFERRKGGRPRSRGRDAVQPPPSYRGAYPAQPPKFVPPGEA